MGWYYFHHDCLRFYVPLKNFSLIWRLWLIDYLRFYVPLKKISLIWRRHHCRWRAAKFRPMLCSQGLWAGRDLFCATPAVTQDLGFSGLIRRTAPFSRLLRHKRGCGGSILTRILTGILYGDVTITGEGLQNLDLCSALGAFEQGTLSCHTCCDTGPRFFFWSHPKDHPI
jgi:hypothetical protein